MRYFLTFFISMLIAACGGDGGSSSSSSESNSSNIAETENAIEGGTPDNPTAVVLSSPHAISSDGFNNYFRYSGVQDEKLVIHADLDNPLSDTERSRCSGNPGDGSTPSSYQTQIHIYDQGLNRISGLCGESLTFEIPNDGIYIVQPDYPGRLGRLFFSSVIGRSAIIAPRGVSGQASNPKTVDFSSANALSSNTFFNYYTFVADKNQKLIVSVTLDEPLTQTQKTRCSGTSAGGSTPSSLKTQIHVYDDAIDRVDGVCGEDLEFSVPSAGSYILHFEFANDQGAGSFNAAIVNAL